LVDNITKPKFAGRMVIILAGYDNDMNNLLRVNEGLSSRFADEISFPSLSSAHCLQLLKDELKQNQIAFPSMQDPIIYQRLLDPITEMSKLPSWGNARDVQTLAKCMVRAVYQSNTTKINQLLLPADTALNCIHDMLTERRARAKVTPSSRPMFSGPVQSLEDLLSVTRISSSTSTVTKIAALVSKEGDEKPSESLETPNEGRDVGVSDAVWQKLQEDKREAELQSQRAAQRIQEQEEAQRLAEEAEKGAEKEAAELREIQAKNEAEALELLRLREEARIREMKAKAERERIQRELERRKQEEEERSKMEELAQSRLRQIGVCVQGFRWTKQSGGYRCAGGSHWVGDSQLWI
jgi:hypothetical protein